MRPRVNKRLAQAAQFPVMLIVAPAGFGKSVALRDYLESERIEAVRYDVRREDGSLLAFVRHFSEAVAPIAPSALAAFPAMQERVLATEEPVRQIADWFVEHLKDASGTVVIDDLHFASTDPASIALLADLVERTSDRIRWIIAGRSDGGLPIATWVAYGRMDIPVGEDDLRFTTDEALTIAEEMDSQLDLQEIEALRQLTEGWPVALTIALRTRTHSGDLRSASSGTRDLIYRYLAEQIFAGLSLQQRAFALSTSVFSGFDDAIAQALGATADFLDEFRDKVTFLNQTEPGKYRYHELFREFLESELRRTGEREWTRALCDGAKILEENERDAEALTLYVRAKAPDETLRILERSGFSLFEQGQSEVLLTALDALTQSQAHTNATALGLRAMIEAGRGRFETGEPFFRAAIENAPEGERRAWLVYRYSLELVRRNQPTPQLLSEYRQDAQLSFALRVEIIATLATAYASQGQYEEMRRAIGDALTLLDPVVGDAVRARVFQQASYCYYIAGDLEQARSFAVRAAEVADAQNLYEVAARAYLNLHACAYEVDEPVECLEILKRVDAAAKKSGSNQSQLFALVAAYEIEVERGNDPSIAELDRILRETRASFPQGYLRALLPAEAMRAGWNGEFRRAYELLRESEAADESPDRRMLRLAEIAVYATAAGLIDEAENAARTASEGLEMHPRATRRAMRTRLLLALAALLRGRTNEAHHHLSAVENLSALLSRRMRSFANAVRVLYRRQLGQSEDADITDALERLVRDQFGGMARLLEVVPIPGSTTGGYSALTSAERSILLLLAGGASTKEIAAKTRRSPHTVDTHIRSICRKLNCSGRREAVALAVSAGWVHT